MLKSKVWNTGTILWQEGDADGISNAALLIHRDNGGTLILQQENDCIVLDDSTVRPLVQLLTEMVKAGKGE